MKLEIGTHVGEYEVTGRLGAGAMGVVYAGVQPVIGKKVAIKVLNPAMTADQQVIKRFINEARAVNQIDHPNIVDIFSFGELEDGSPYLVMPLLEGRTFGALLRERDTISADELIEILEPVAEAVDAAHAAGIIHRDLKPDNIFVVERPNGRVDVRVLDFGVAKLLDSTVSSTRGPIGTPLYMAPEQCIANREVDGRADVYAFGVLAFHALTGRYPLEANSLVKLVSLHLQGDPPERPSDCGASIVLDGPILRCLEANPDDRYGTLSEALRALALAVGEMTDSSNPIESTGVDWLSETLPSDTPPALASTLSSAALAKEAADTNADKRPRSKLPYLAAALAVASAGAIAGIVTLSGGGGDDRGSASAPTVSIDAAPVAVAPSPDAGRRLAAASPDAGPVAIVADAGVARARARSRPGRACDPEKLQSCRSDRERLKALRKFVRGNYRDKLATLKRVARGDSSSAIRATAMKGVGSAVAARSSKLVKASTLNWLVARLRHEPDPKVRTAATSAYHQLAGLQGATTGGSVYIKVGTMKARNSAQKTAMVTAARVAIRNSGWATNRPRKTGWVINGTVKTVTSMPMSGRAKCVVVLSLHTLKRSGFQMFDMGGETPAADKSDKAAIQAQAGCVAGMMAELIERHALPRIKRNSQKK